MTDAVDTTTPAAPAAPAPVPAPTAPAAQPAAPAVPAKPDTDWVAEARKWEDRAKANKAAADELAAVKAAQAEQQQTVEQQLKALQDRLNKSDAEAARLRVAAAKGVPAELLAGVSGDEAALSAYADQLVAFRGAAPVAPSLQVPGVGNTPPAPPSAAQQAAAAEAKGDYRASMALKMAQLSEQR